LNLSPSCAHAEPFHIPVEIGLVGPDVQDMPQRMAGSNPTLLSLKSESQQFIFEDVAVVPVPSLLRNFSAPVVLDFAYSDEDLVHLLAHDTDPFNRWEAGQRLASRLILDAAARISAGEAPVWPVSFAAAARRVLTEAEPAFAAEALSLPGEATLAEQMAVVDPDALHAARNGLRRFLADQLNVEFKDCYQRLAPIGAYCPDSSAAGRRALRNVCLGYLCEIETARAVAQFNTADNMTDQFAALSVLAQGEGDERVRALKDFYQRWQNEPLVVDKWLQVQAASQNSNTLAEVERLVEHPAFDLRNPNKVYALLRAFGSNHVRFHAADGSGYRFLAEQTARLDAINPQVASRLARCFDRWRKFDTGRQAHARAALERLRGHPSLSRDVYEIVERSLG
jgi:aminopeptidase N